MGRLFYVMGKSASGKDTLYARLLEIEELSLKRLTLYTTRPMREHEVQDREYHFVTEEIMHEMQQQGRIMEMRCYQTVHGPWYYFTAQDETMNLAEHDYIAIGTLESYQNMRAYYASRKEEDLLVPIYIEVEDSLRLERYISRERNEEKPNYEEVCRRFLADQQDFSEEKIAQARIVRRYDNSSDMEACLRQIVQDIKDTHR